MTVTAFN